MMSAVTQPKGQGSLVSDPIHFQKGTNSGAAEHVVILSKPGKFRLLKIILKPAANLL